MTLRLDRLKAGRPVLIAGPTASGKSALALEAARTIAAAGGNAAIVNADSMQVYRDLRILTSRPSAEEEAEIPHRLFGTVPASARYSLGRWLADMEMTLTELRASRRVPIVVGGTGLYFGALTEGIASVPEIVEEVRSHWAAELKNRGSASLHRTLQDRDPESAALLRPSDPQRVVRALEVLDSTGTPLRHWQRERTIPLLPARETVRLVTEIDRRDLAGRISARFDAMIRAGGWEEAKALISLDLPRNFPAMKAIGVQEIGAALRGEISPVEAAERAKAATRRYAKRQLTWLRNRMNDWERLPV